MKVLQVITDTDRRGAQVFAMDLQDGLERRGHDVRTMALVRGDNPERLEVDVIGSTPHSRASLRRLRAEMADADITIAHGSSTLVACGIAGLGPGRPFVYRQISDSRFWAPTVVKRARVRMLMGRARLVVALAQFTMDELVAWIRLPARRIRIVPNGVPAHRFGLLDAADRPAARRSIGIDECQTALFIAALVEEKGADLAIEATARVEGWQLLVAGDGPERSALEALAAERTPGRVRFLGSIRDPRQAYAAADLVVFPSRGGDSMPAALVEAGLCGLPAIATPVGAIPEVVLDGATGLVIPIGDLGALVAGWTTLAADEPRRNAMGAAAHRHCLDRFEIDTVAKAWESVLDEALQAGRTAAG